MAQIILEYSSALGSPRTGVGWYTEGLARELIQAHKKYDWMINLFAFDFRRRAKKQIDPALFPFFSGFRLFPGKVIQRLWRYNRSPSFEFFAGSCDLVHFPNFVIPSVLGKAKSFVTIHDLAFRRYPESCEPKNLHYLLHEMPKTLQRAHKIVVPSEFTKSELLSFYPSCSTDKVLVVGQGVHDDHWQAEGSKTSSPLLYEGKPFFFSVGTLEPRKNFAGLIQGFSLLKQNKRYKDVKLVITGGEGWLDHGITNEMKQSLGDDLVLAGYLSRAELLRHYTQCTGFVLASFYEGFGRPLLEAMVHKAPLLCSNRPWAKELCGDLAWYFDPYFPDSIRSAFESFLATPQVEKDRRLMLAKNLAERYRWPIVLAPLWQAYQASLS